MLSGTIILHATREQEPPPTQGTIWLNSSKNFHLWSDIDLVHSGWYVLLWPPFKVVLWSPINSITKIVRHLVNLYHSCVKESLRIRLQVFGTNLGDVKNETWFLRNLYHPWTKSWCQLVSVYFAAKTKCPYWHWKSCQNLESCRHNIAVRVVYWADASEGSFFEISENQIMP